MKDEEDIEEIELISDVKEDVEQLQKEKKEQEISEKRKYLFSLSQSNDAAEHDSVWGLFRSRTKDSLEIMEDEPIYRTPFTNVVENEKEFYLLIELPGLDKRSVKITLQEGILEIVGEKVKEDKHKKEKKDKDKDKEKKDKDKEKKDKKKEKFKEIKGSFLRHEFKSAIFYRAFQLPEDILSEEIDANFREGVLTLRMLKESAIIKEKHVIDIK
ncbi:hypothetical protein LCGC14_0779410 [marine sediment metagenome]|uniref:SHSP domain-containing protein n=1 Tax=marine sediment metagenome TaxID=412755 RepID=A0A0F9QFV0_9ZZZZ